MLGTMQFRTHLTASSLRNGITNPASFRAPPLPAIVRKSKSRSGWAAFSAADAPIATFGREERDDARDSISLPPGLRQEALPKHVAFIMDGNGRWAAERELPPSAGHQAGYKTLQLMVELSVKWGIRVLTVFAFSTENWLRPKLEVDFLMTLLETALKDNLQDFLREGIRICIIGDSSKLPKSVQEIAAKLEESTSNNSKLDLLVAISYSGRTDIVQACKKISQKVKNGVLKVEDIDESLVAQELETSCAALYPYPDLLIRTSGEWRLSNFLLWEMAYTELYFAQSYWPDFGEKEFVEALFAFQRRQRRFGLRRQTIGVNQP
ncbi:hypothetical protein HPP92_012241 [Vanilla planifolia]|uniref:Alkyl transferase n=1 Tax=Vanilla planifolia TaxID=51239 RepID=A0A835RDA3_VANPL|nr:hypothetical protein HPP92_012241 [Vanilla planifolia]